jgi:hypothetical protein
MMAKTPARAIAKKRIRAAANRDQKQRMREKKLTESLIAMLSKYMILHYGNPRTGRHAAILDGPVIARLSAAASLRALLLETGGDMRRQLR